jgi:hypothetical protein
MRPRLSTLGLFLALAANAGCAAAEPSTFTPHADDWRQLRGDYVLDDGHVVHLVGTRRHPRAEFDDGRSVALAAASVTDYLTPDGCTRLRFELNDNATLARVRVTRLRDCP